MNTLKNPPPVNLPRARMQPAAPVLKWWPYTQADDRVPTKGTGHLHWGVQAFSKVDEGTGELADVVAVEVEADSEEQAISRAQEIIQRNGYRITWIREACSADKEIQQ